jgi:hypothetical protein
MTYNVRKLVPCTDRVNTLCKFNATTLKMYSGIDKFTLDGYFEIEQNLPAPIVVRVLFFLFFTLMMIG